MNRLPGWLVSLAPCAWFLVPAPCACGREAPAPARAPRGHFVEIDVIVPEIAAGDAKAQSEPWFPLVRAPRDPARPVVAWKRGERSFVVVLPPT